jgi:NADPH2 dehydrogenase
MAALFDEISFRGMTLKNRIVVSPMCQYQALEDGVSTDWHLVHYGSLAMSGASLVFVEATAVEARGRISTKDLGLYSDDHVSGLLRIVDFGHSQGTMMGIQLNHAGRKADVDGPIVAPSSVRFSEKYAIPEAITEEDIEEAVQAFASAAKRSVAAGFDVIEIHAAHGYLLNQFLSPLSNRRSDAYGGSVENRLRFPLQVVSAIRAVIPSTMPLFLRVSAVEYVDNGYSMAEMVQFCRGFRDAGVDLVDVSTGGNVPVMPSAVYPGYQIAPAAQIRREADICVGGVGMLDNVELSEYLVQSGQVDLVSVARGFLRNKTWGHDAAITLHRPIHPPKPYTRAYPQH